MKSNDYKLTKPNLKKPMLQLSAYWGDELEIFKNRFVNGKTLFYVCKNNTCELPVEDFNLLINKLKS